MKIRMVVELNVDGSLRSEDPTAMYAVSVVNALRREAENIGLTPDSEDDAAVREVKVFDEDGQFLVGQKV